MLPLYRSAQGKGTSIGQRLWKRKRSLLFYCFIMALILVYVYMAPSSRERQTQEVTPQDQAITQVHVTQEDSVVLPDSQHLNLNDDKVTQPIQKINTAPTASKAMGIPEKAEAVKQAFLHAYESYEKYAFGHDELKPLSRSYHDWVPGGIGMTIIDSLSTMMLMGLDDHITRARNWVATSLNFNKNFGISVFETNIRMLGGLISAYDLSVHRGKPEKVFLDKAVDIADRLMKAFNTRSGIPYSTVNLQTGHGHGAHWTGGSSVLSEVGTLQLEFQRLSQLTGRPEFQEKALRIFDIISERASTDGLYPTFIHPDTGHFTSSHITFGALGDSYYEYLLKVWLQGRKTQTKLRQMFDQSMSGMLSRLTFKSSPSGLTYVAEMNHGSIDHKMDHLACFVGGMLGLGSLDVSDPATKNRYLDTGKGITETCYQMYARNRHGLSPEFVRFTQGNDFVTGAAYYIQRPEAVESMFIMYRLTKDPKYQEWAWQVFQAIERNCRVQGGYTGLRNVDTGSPPQDDHMQSFFLAETLKYLYLIFAPESTLDISQWVFNTEAHPIRVKEQ